MIDSFKISFNQLENNKTASINVYSKFTCIIGNDSGEGKTEFYSLLEEGFSDGSTSIDAPLPVVLVNEGAFDGIIANKEPYICIIDEGGMFLDRRIRSMNKSPHYFIIISRGITSNISYPYCGIYEIARDGDWFNIQHTSRLNVVKELHFKYRTILTESAPNRSEHELLSVYLDNVQACSGRDRIYKRIRNAGDSTLIIADLGDIGPAFSILSTMCKEYDIELYDYQCFEQLLYESQLVQQLQPLMDSEESFSSSYISVEKFYEKLLEERTKSTYLEYKHKMPLSKEFLNKENLYKVFSSTVGEGLLNYINNNQKQPSDEMNLF